MPFLVGVLVSAVVGYAAIAWLIRYLQSNSLKVFMVYDRGGRDCDRPRVNVAPPVIAETLAVPLVLACT